MSKPNTTRVVTPLPAYASFAMISGNNTIVPFQSFSGMQQSLTGEGAIIDAKCYHTKLYTTTGPVTVNLGMGTQFGQMKKITFVHKGTADGNVIVSCPTLMGDYTELTFSEIGDQAELMWSGGQQWVVMSTLNIVSPASPTPVVS
jgi:hypothetical protein